MKKTVHFPFSIFHSPFVITSPDCLRNEKEYVISLFEAGLEILHLRKPNTTKEEYEQILNTIPQKYHARITLHDFFELTEKYDVGGVHLNRKNPAYKGNKKLRISRSCHSLEELKAIDSFDYVFLSPIFDSISKEGYGATFSHEELLQASKKGLINEKVIALGGIDKKTLPQLKPCAFGGVALLGAIWNQNGQSPVENYKSILHCK